MANSIRIIEYEVVIIYQPDKVFIGTCAEAEQSVRLVRGTPVRIAKAVAAFAAAAVVGCGIFAFASYYENNVDFGFSSATPQPSGNGQPMQALFANHEETHAVTLFLEGKEMTVITPCDTVGQLLSTYGITPDENDFLNCSLEDKIRSGITIVYDRVDVLTSQVREVVPYTKEIQEVQTIPYRTSQVISEGVDGVVERTIKQTFINGKLSGEDVLSESVLTEMVPQVELYGIGGSYVGADGNTYEFSYYVDVEATAYGGEMFSGATFTGKQVAIGMIAVDPDVIPLGSSVYVTGDVYDFGVCAAEDTGGAIIGNKIDIYMGNDMDAMYRFGRRPMRVYVLK